MFLSKFRFRTYHWRLCKFKISLKNDVSLTCQVFFIYYTVIPSMYVANNCSLNAWLQLNMIILITLQRSHDISDGLTVEHQQHISRVSWIADKEASKCDRRLFMFRRNYSRILGNVNCSHWQWHVISAYCICWWLLFGYYSPSFIMRLFLTNESIRFDLEMICWKSWQDTLWFLLVIILTFCVAIVLGTFKRQL